MNPIRKFYFLILAIKLCLLYACSNPEKKENNLKNHPVITEIIFADTSDAVHEKINSFLKNNEELYRWKTHWVIYHQSPNQEAFKDSILAAYPDAELKAYDNIFYHFNRNRCEDSTSVSKWDNIILTTNLVEDTILQREYMNYHATQFKDWPELSNGFCNANFQQLLMYRNGRQLMLVISIPKGESLDKLNPKTTENNPKVKEWNTLMKKYQEGISGTSEGEIWVMFKKYKK